MGYLNDGPGLYTKGNFIQINIHEDCKKNLCLSRASSARAKLKGAIDTGRMVCSMTAQLVRATVALNQQKERVAEHDRGFAGGAGADHRQRTLVNSPMRSR